MEITNTTVTNTARHIADNVAFNIDYTIVNGKLERVQLNIFMINDESDNETYLGTVYFDGRNVTCNIPWEENVSYYFETATGFIAQIIESSHTNEEQSTDDTGKNINDKSR